jgi:hypothetical protein
VTPRPCIRRAPLCALPVLLLCLPVALPAPSAAGEYVGAFCCPKTTFCRPEAPCIKWKCVCPKPVCNPCNLPHYGYYHTCWRPWFYPPDYGHCPYPPPSVALAESLAMPSLPANQGSTGGPTITLPQQSGEQLPFPR